MTRSVSDDFEAAGALAAPWVAFAGAAPSKASGRLGWSVAPGTNPIAGVLMGKRGPGRADLEVSARPNHVFGNAIYPRIVDASNWVRAVVRAVETTSTYYVTEYQHTSYTTEYLWNSNYWGDTYLQRTLQRQVQYPTGTCGASGWTNWSNSGSPTGCRASSPTPPSATIGACGQATAMYQYVPVNCGVCLNGNCQYQLQVMTRTVIANSAFKWVNDGYTLASGESFTGSTQYISGSTYVAASGSTSAGNPGKTTSPSSGNDLYQGTSLYGSGTYWRTTAIDGNDSSAGSSRQVASGTYWDQTYEAGAPTRQTGPFTGTSTFYDVELEQSVAGTITSLGTFRHGSSALTGFKVRADNDTLSVYLNGSGTPVLTGTSSAHKNSGIYAGIGGGASSYGAVNPSFLDFSAVGLTREYARSGAGAWVPAERKIKAASGWVATDAALM